MNRQKWLHEILEASHQLSRNNQAKNVYLGEFTYSIQLHYFENMKFGGYIQLKLCVRLVVD